VSQARAPRRNDDALELVNLHRLMALTGGERAVAIGLLDGPVATDHPALVGARIRPALEHTPVACTTHRDGACAHGTFVAGVLSSARDSRAPAICPDCTLLVRPIFADGGVGSSPPAATPAEVGRAIAECVAAGARVLNLSAATHEPSTRAERRLEHALDHAAQRGVLVVAAAGNRATLGSSAITRHPWVIPVVGYDARGRPLNQSTLGNSIGKGGLGAPGDAIESLGPDASFRVAGGTSVAAAFVTGTLALLWSLYPRVSAHELRGALLHGRRRRAVTPPMLDAVQALRAIRTNEGG
jgi:subtilisin family serine protease